MNPANDTLLHDLDQREIAALLSADFAALEALWSAELIVNNPANVVADRSTLFELVRSGVVAYTSFDRRMEGFLIAGNLAVAMGHEIVTPSPGAPLAGKVVNRRYTNVWHQTDGSWQLVARQATIVSVR